MLSSTLVSMAFATEHPVVAHSEYRPVEAMVRAYARRRLRPLLEQYEVLEVERADGGGTLLVPLISDAVRTVDLERKLIDIDLDFLGEE